MRTNTGLRSASTVLLLLALVIVAATWGAEIEAFVQALPWNVAVAFAGALSAAFGIAAASVVTRLVRGR